MTWLIRLYPPAWQRRYGRELADLLATQPASVRTGIDVIAGAADAWLNPQASTAATAHAQGEGTMIAKKLKLRCTGDGPAYTKADAIKAAVVMLGGTLAFVLVLTWAMGRYGKNDFLEALLAVSWLFPFLYSQRYTELKGRSGRVQAALIGGPALILLAIVFSATWINNG